MRITPDLKDSARVRILLLVWVCLAPTVLAACGNDDQRDLGNEVSIQDAGGPVLRLLDSVILQDSDSAYIAFPAIGFTVDDRGLIYVPDLFGKRLFRFRPTGELDLIFGAPGRGPGEFGSMGPATLIHDTIVLQGTSRQLMGFHRSDGRFLFTRRTQGYVLHGFVAADTAYLGYFDYGTRRGLLKVAANELFAPDPGPVPQALQANLLPVPREYDEFPELITLSGATVAMRGDSLVAGFGGTQHLRVLAGDGTVLQEFEIPVRRRRGVPAGAYEVYKPGPIDFKAHVEAVSSLRQIWRLPDGRILGLIIDGWVEDVGGQETSFSTAWISLVDLDGSRACVDTKLPFPGTDKPRVTLRGDTLYALDHVEQPGDSLALQAVIRRYLVGDTGCEWMDLVPR
jgi:hypothetical protein